jgi:hypothetical protein
MFEFPFQPLSADISGYPTQQSSQTACRYAVEQ